MAKRSEGLMLLQGGNPPLNRGIYLVEGRSTQLLAFVPQGLTPTNEDASAIEVAFYEKGSVLGRDAVAAICAGHVGQS